MDTSTIASNYLRYLEEGNTQKIVSLFAKDGMVSSPLYGLMPAQEFYTQLAKDTTASQLISKGIFKDTLKKQVALFFTYHWTLNNGSQSSFEVVDILEFDDVLEIKKLTIIYDTAHTRKQHASLSKD